ncbi:MAG: ABA4-like family protein [Cyanobacteria bacterium J06632_22]
MIFEYIFNFGNLFVLPFWLLMVIAPSWTVTRRVMDSMIPFAVLAGLYIYCFIGSLDPDKLESFANPTLTVLAELFAEAPVMATGWVHFLVMDLFVGRWIYLQGQEKGLWTRHSLTLCLFAGPMGLLSHIVTAWIQPRFQPTPQQAGDAA